MALTGDEALVGRVLNDRYLIGERIARNSNRLAALAALLLPPSVVAGLFGMNVGGIPGVNDTWAFVVIVAFVAIISVATLMVLKRINWL